MCCQVCFQLQGLNMSVLHVQTNVSELCGAEGESLLTKQICWAAVRCTQSSRALESMKSVKVSDWCGPGFCSPDSSILSPNSSCNGPSSQPDSPLASHQPVITSETLSTPSRSTANPEQKQSDVPIKAAISTHLSTQRCVLPQRETSFIHLCRQTPGSRFKRKNIPNFRAAKTQFDSSFMSYEETLSRFIFHLLFHVPDQNVPLFTLFQDFWSNF